MKIEWIWCVFDAADAVFDASQYAFFGKDVVEEVELGGLEDEDDSSMTAPRFDEEEFLFDKEEVKFFYFNQIFFDFLNVLHYV